MKVTLELTPHEFMVLDGCFEEGLQAEYVREHEHASALTGVQRAALNRVVIKLHDARQKVVRNG